MGIRKQYVVVSFLLAMIAVGVGLLAGSRPILKAAQESGKGPRARLQVASHPPKVLFSTAEERDDYPRFLKTQEALIKSRFVLGAALRDPEIARLPSIKDRTDAMTWLQQSLEVNNPKDTEILEISMVPGSGLSGADQAAIVNAVKRAYVDEVVNYDARRRVERHEQLKKLRATYAVILKEKRDHMRRLAESVGRDQHLGGLERDALPRFYHDLRTQRVKLRMERAEAETLLARRKKAEGAASDPARKEIAQIEDRLAVLIAGQNVLDEELERLTQEMHGTVHQTLDLAAQKDEISQLEETSRKIGAEVEALNVELQAPPRVRTIDDAASPRP